MFLQIDGTKGKAGRGLVPNAELGVPRGADLRKLFPAGKRIETAKVIETSQGRIRLSVKAAEEDRERAEFDGYRRDAGAPPASFGTLGDRLKHATKKSRA